jgi:hypothetical protein
MTRAQVITLASPLAVATVLMVAALIGHFA